MFHWYLARPQQSGLERHPESIKLFRLQMDSPHAQMYTQQRSSCIMIGIAAVLWLIWKSSI